MEPHRAERKTDVRALQERRLVLADRFSNVGITVIHNVRKWVAQDDAAINQALITPELVAWLNT